MALPNTTYRMKLRTGQQPKTTFNIPLNKGKNDVLLAGPWIGEFGWELFVWQAYIRNIAPKYKKVIVSSRKGHEFLYEDFCTEFIPIDVPKNALSNSWFCDGISTDFTEKFAAGIKFDTRIPAKNIGFLYHGDGHATIKEGFYQQNFIKYQSDSLDKSFDILIHPRNKDLGHDRNWNQEKWQKLVDLLSKKYSIGTIGSHEAFNLNDSEDCRNISIRDTVSLMNRTKLVVGQSSGPMHLASLSGTPHLVWSTEHNRRRYFEYWNPFNTPVYFYPEMGWNPTPEFIYEKIIENIES